MKDGRKGRRKRMREGRKQVKKGEARKEGDRVRGRRGEEKMRYGIEGRRRRREGTEGGGGNEGGGKEKQGVEAGGYFLLSRLTHLAHTPSADSLSLTPPTPVPLPSPRTLQPLFTPLPHPTSIYRPR